jgi:hypothetical protein
LFLKCSLISRFTYIVQIIYIASAWILYPKHFGLLHFVPKKPKHSSSNHGLCYFNSYRPRLSLGKVFIFPLMFFQALFLSSSSHTFSNAANLFVISV